MTPLFIVGCWFLLIEPTYTKYIFMQPIFNAMTPYFWVKDKYENITENENSTIMYKGDTCQIVNLNLLLRHAARYPSLYWIHRMNRLHTRLKNNSQAVERQPFLQNWTSPFPDSLEYSQSAIGDDEKIQLGRRFGLRFKQLFDGNMDRIKYSVTTKNVTYESFKTFQESLSDTLNSSNSRPKAEIKNKQLRFYSYCKNYDQLGEKANSEYNLFLGGSEMKNVVDKIKIKLDNSISKEDVNTMHQICAFELGMSNRSDWCHLFDMDDLLAIDYLSDITNYWHRGYGYPINWKISCPFTSNMFQSFDRFIQRNNANNVTIADIQFAHSYTMLHVYTVFGLFKDQNKLLASNYDINKNRLFRTSKICPFSANFGVGLYKCDGVQDYVVKMFVNEEEVVIPACTSTICTYTEMKQYYNSLIGCDFDGICGNKYKKKW